MEAKTYIAKEKETVRAFKLKEEIYDELIKTLLDNGVPLTFGEGCDNPFVELPACGGGTEVAVIGDYIAPFGSCFRVYKQSLFEDSFVLKGEASKEIALREMTLKAYTHLLKKYLSCLEYFEKLAKCIQEDPFQEKEETAETVNELCLIANSGWSEIISVTAKLKRLEGEDGK